MYWHLLVRTVAKSLYSILCQKEHKNNEDLIQRFTNAIYKRQKWVDTHSPEEIAEAIRFFDTDLETLKNVARRYKEIDAWNKDPVLKEHSFDLMQTVMEEAQVLDKRAP